MQRARRLDRPVTTKWPGGRMQGRGRATTNEPTCISSQAGDKGFPRSPGVFSVPRNCCWQPASGIRNRVTHGVRFPPPPCSAPLRGRVRTARAAAATLDAFRSRRPFALASRPGPRGARTCRSGRGRDRRWHSGNSKHPAARPHRLTPKRQRCQRPTPLFRAWPAVQGDSFLSVQLSFLVHRFSRRKAPRKQGLTAQ